MPTRIDRRFEDLARQNRAALVTFLMAGDPDLATCRWAAKRKDRALPVRAMSSAKLPSALNVLSKRNISLVVLDTPALESPASLTAIGAADLSVVPARPGTFDIWASEVTGRKLRLMDKEFVFLLNQCPPAREASHVQEGIAALEAIGYLLHPHIRTRPAFLDAAGMGKGVTEVDPKGAAAREVRALWLALKHRLPLNQIHR